MNWADVSPLWQQAFELAWQSHRAGSNPIGALVSDASGRVVSTGKSAVRAEMKDVVVCHNEIAHAEVNALLGLDNRQHGKQQAAGYTLYATLEPCPVCFSAFYMSDVGTLRFAARDAFGGSTNLLGTTPYLSRKQRKLVGPEPVLAGFSVFLNVLHDLRAGLPEDDPVHAAFESDYPRAVALGREAAGVGAVAEESSVERMFEEYQVLGSGRTR